MILNTDRLFSVVFLRGVMLNRFHYEWDAEKPDPIHIRAIYAVLEGVRKMLNLICR